ncbi:hypothetical protein JE944_003117 [Yersinia ruckeri]|nr:hypothetical protein [Yersinia ruckeri]
MMLDNEKQIAAFKALAVEGIHAPASLITAQATGEQATSKAGLLDSMVKPEITYPASVSDSLKKITNASLILAAAASAANQFSLAINGYQSPSQLIQMRIGWECYLKGNELNADTPFYLIDAIADVELTLAQSQLISAIQTGNTEAAMKDINSTLSVGAGIGVGDVSGSGGLTPQLTDKQIVRLATAAAELISSLSGVGTTSETVKALAEKASDSAHKANLSFSDAVGVSIISGLLESTVMAGALKAITPSSVINALS